MRVVVLGSGVIGLTSALRLAERGAHTTVVSADPLEQTTSWIAAAVWFPTAAGPAGRVATWSAATYRVLVDDVRHGRPGVLMRESLSLYRSDPGEPDWTTSVGAVRAATRAELPEGYAAGLRYAVPLAEMSLYLPDLAARCAAAGVAFVQRRVAKLDELLDLLDLAPDVIVNAAGLAAGALAGDDSMYPIRGQIVRVTNPGLTMSVRDEGHPGGRAYIHPRTTDCVLGGTLDVGQWNTAPDPSVSDAIVERCSSIVPALHEAEVLESLVGLRPGRDEIRLELDRTLLPVPVVHNYGHGGSGLTTAWGCADEVADLVFA